MTAGHAAGAVHVHRGILDAHTFDTTVPVLAVCRPGNRSGSAAMRLAAARRYRLQHGRRHDGVTGNRAPVIRDEGTAGTVI